MSSILIIDDTDKYWELCTRYMPEHEFLPPARNYREAAETLGRARGVDLVLLDVHFDIPEEELLPYDKGAVVKAHDYRGMENMKQIFKDRVEWCHDPVTAAAGADAVALTTDWPQYTTLPFRKIAATMNQPIIFDGRNCLQRDVMRETGFQYYPMGRPAVENALRLKTRA